MATFRQVFRSQKQTDQEGYCCRWKPTVRLSLRLLNLVLLYFSERQSNESWWERTNMKPGDKIDISLETEMAEMYKMK